MARKESPSSSPTNAHDPTPDSSSVLSTSVEASPPMAASDHPSLTSPPSVNDAMVGSMVPSATSMVCSRPAGNGNDYFTCGSLVRCLTCHEVTIEGHVMAFDPQTRILAIKLPSTSKRSSLIDMTMVNLHLVKDIVLISDPNENSSVELNKVSSGLNINQLNNRAMNNLDKKKRLVKAFKKGITPEGQRVFHAISKTLEDIDWSGDNIKVMGHVTITPPYKPDNVRGVSDSKAVMHVRKIIEKHLEDSKRGLAAAEWTKTVISTVPSESMSLDSAHCDLSPTSPSVSSPRNTYSNTNLLNKKGNGAGGGNGIGSKQHESPRSTAMPTATVVSTSGGSGGVGQQTSGDSGVGAPTTTGSSGTVKGVPKPMYN